jgi:uncharacterized membrane protein
MSNKVPFRLRGKEVSRVEAFSDVVFGFALTLIVVSLEVPKTFAALMEVLGGFLGFAICFALLTWIWHCHHTFFRRYAMTDEITIALNTVLLFLVLFYTYPLKFVFELVTGDVRSLTRADGVTLFLIYGLGFAGIFAVFCLLYVHAWMRRERLELNLVERHDTITALIMYSSYILVGLISVTIALTGLSLAWAGLSYFLLGPVSAVIGFWRGSIRDRVVGAMLATGAGSTTPTPDRTADMPTPSPASPTSV